VQWCADGEFLRHVFSVSHVQHTSDMHSKFALRPHHVCKYGRHPIRNCWVICEAEKQAYDFQFWTISATLSYLQLYFLYTLSFHQVDQQVHSFPTLCSLPLTVPSLLYHAVMIHVLAHALTTRLHFFTVSNTVLVMAAPQCKEVQWFNCRPLPLKRPYNKYSLQYL